MFHQFSISPLVCCTEETLRSRSYSALSYVFVLSVTVVTKNGQSCISAGHQTSYFIELLFWKHNTDIFVGSFQ